MSLENRSLDTKVFTQDFLNYLNVEKNCSKNTIDAYTFDLAKFESFLIQRNIVDVTKVSREVVARFILKLKEEKYAEKSVYRMLACVKSFYRFMYREHYIERNPLLDMDHPKMTESVPEVLDEEEVIKMLSLPAANYIQIRNMAILEFLYATGCRVSELTHVMLKDISLKTLLVTLHGKGRKDRVVPFHSKCAYALRRWITLRTRKDPDRALFMTRQGQRLSRFDVWKIIKAMGVTAGIEKKISPHTFRHSYATHLMNNGADIRMIQELLGHASINSTQVYLQLNTKDLQEKFEKYHPSNIRARKAGKRCRKRHKRVYPPPPPHEV